MTIFKCDMCGKTISDNVVNVDFSGNMQSSFHYDLCHWCASKLRLELEEKRKKVSKDNAGV